eukprot:327558-Chlamydomonas_euryale.AAC.4
MRHEHCQRVPAEAQHDRVARAARRAENALQVCRVHAARHVEQHAGVVARRRRGDAFAIPAAAAAALAATFGSPRRAAIALCVATAQCAAVADAAIGCRRRRYPPHRVAVRSESRRRKCARAGHRQQPQHCAAAARHRKDKHRARGVVVDRACAG